MRKFHFYYDGKNHTVDSEYNDISMKKKLVVRIGIIAIGLDEKSFSGSILRFTPGWDYKHCNEDFSRKIENLSTKYKNHINCDVTDGSVANGVR